MILKDLKEWVNSLTEEQLIMPLLYNSQAHAISGVVESIGVAESNLYYTGEDDPSVLYTKKQLKERGYDKDDIEGFDIEIPKGSFYIKF